MFTKKAKQNFLGLSGNKRLNCTQSVMDAFNSTNEETFNVKDYASYGAGRAPNGECGAYYASKIILENYSPENLIMFEKHITELAGSIKCREIRKIGKLKCIDCVENCADFIKKFI